MVGKYPGALARVSEGGCISVVRHPNGVWISLVWLGCSDGAHNGGLRDTLLVASVSCFISYPFGPLLIQKLTPHRLVDCTLYSALLLQALDY